jgi:hypothetical protein
MKQPAGSGGRALAQFMPADSAGSRSGVVKCAVVAELLAEAIP